jgi:cytoskeletal protein CcmA (bactofilin family)
MLNDNEKKTLVEDGTHFKGSLTSTVPIVVRGRIEGEVKAPSLRISETGAVHGRVTVEEIVSEGELSGEFDANLVQLSGVVKDKTIVRARSLQVKLVASGIMEAVFGECLLDVGDLPDKQAAINSSLSDVRGGSRAASLAPRDKGGADAGRNGSHGTGSSPPEASESRVEPAIIEGSAVPAEMMADAPRGRKSQSPPKRS